MAGRLLARAQRTRGRLALGIAVGGALALAAFAIGLTGGGRGPIVELLTEAAFLVAVPVVAVVLGVAALGDLHEDGTLVYVWLRPIPRWRLALVAVASSLSIALPLNAAIVSGIVLAGRQPELLGGALAATGLATLAYVALFVALGLRTTRSMLWGLAYVLVLEGFLARVSDGLAAVTVRRYAAAVLAELAHVDATVGSAISLGGAVSSLLGIAVLGTVLTGWWLRTRDVP